MGMFHGVVAVVTGLGKSSVGDARGGLLCRQDRLGGGRSRSAGPARGERYVFTDWSGLVLGARPCLPESRSYPE
jgi:hypothetical protein